MKHDPEILLHPYLDVEALSRRIRRSPKSIQNDLSRRPESLPPRFSPPGGTRNLQLWRLVDVLEWEERIAAEAKAQHTISQGFSPPWKPRRSR
ncbi:MAG TPA: hypothetical protein VJ598_09150 [Albitalea sp.]|nr:hypothetical protein [Albitalea sp.]